MHLKKITLNNFRCFERLELELHPRLTVIVAENGGGKTSLLDGIALGLAPILQNLTSANQRLEGPSFKDNDFRMVSSGTRAEIKADYVQVIVETADGLVWDHWRPSSKGNQPPFKVGQAGLSFLGSILESYKSPRPGTLPVFAYYGALRGWIEIPERLRGSKKNEPNYEYPTSALAGCLDAVSDFRELLKWFDREETSELRRQKEAEDGFDPSLALDAVRAAIIGMLGDSFYDPHFDSRHKFVVRSKGELKQQQVSQISQGYQSMLALAMDFSRRLALANPHLMNDPEAIEMGLDYFHKWDGGGKQKEEDRDSEFMEALSKGSSFAPAVMLVDEIDLHLHPSWQQKVLGDLMVVFPHTQFIVTTHSPQVLSTARRENIRVLGRAEQGEWVARVPDRNPYAHASSMSLESVMGGSAYPPLEVAATLRHYQTLVGNDEHDTEEALGLRRALEEEWGKTDPEILLIDVAIRKNEVLRKIRNSKI